MIATIAIQLTTGAGICLAQPVAPLANPNATSATAVEPTVLRERSPRGPGRQTVGLRLGAARVTSAVQVSETATTTLEPVPGAGDWRALRVDDGLETRFLVVTIRPRLATVAELGPVAADEEHPVRLEARTVSGGVDVGIVVSGGDSCGRHTMRVDVHRVANGQGHGVRVAAVELAAAPASTLPTTPTTDASAGYATIATGIGTHGLITAGFDRLSDHDPATSLPETPGGGRFIARFGLAPLRVRGVRIAVRPGANGRRDLVLAIGDERFAVAPDSDAFEVRFPAPRDARCVAIELPEPGAAGVAEFAFLPDLDTDEARANQLVIELASEGLRADGAIEALGRLGAAAVGTLVEAYPDALPAEKRRILRAAELISATEPDALRLFVVALEEDDESVRTFALDRSIAMGTRGLRVLSTSVRRGNAELARVFADRAAFASLGPILDRLGEAEDAERRILHEALVVAARDDVARVRPALRAYVESGADERSRALVLDVLRASGDHAGIVAALDLWWTTAPSTETVEVLLRWIGAIGAVPPAERTDAMNRLVESALSNEVWMVRAAAIDALASDPTRRELVRRGLDDESPRVRIGAIASLLDDEGSRRRIAELSRNDEWPIVRVAALGVVVPLEGSDALVRDALTERSTRVRIGTFALLAERRDERFVADAIGVLERGRAPANVQVAAIRYLEAMCAAQAESVLVAAIDLELREDTEGHRAVALAAARALERFGSPDAVASARRLVDPTRSGAAQARCTAP